MLRALRKDERPPATDRIRESGRVEVVRADLGPDDAARIVRLYNRTIVLVSGEALSAMVPIVAGHALRRHDGDLACTMATCPQLWPWFRTRSATA